MFEKTNTLKFALALVVLSALSPIAIEPQSNTGSRNIATIEIEPSAMSVHTGSRTLIDSSLTGQGPTGAALMSIDAGEYKRFVSSPERPSIADILDSVKSGQIKLASPEKIVNSDYFKEFRADRLASVIASFENAYPGLTYVFLGRDSAFLADAIEAFYLSNGQVGRVKRLKASGDSIYNAQPGELMLFLRQNGFVPTSRGLPHPFIIIDRTSYDDNSQMKRLLEVGYTSLIVAAGVDPEKAMRQFAGVHVGGGHLHSSIPSSSDLEREFFSGLQLLSQRRASPNRILHIPAPTFIDRSFWQMKYGKFGTDANGRLSARVGSPASELERGSVLYEILGAIAVVTTKDFRDLVEQASRNLLNAEFKLNTRAKISLPTGVTAQSSEITNEGRLSAIEFLASYDGSVEKRYQLSRSLSIKDPHLSKIAQSIAQLVDQNPKYSDIGQTAIVYVSSLDVLLGLGKEERATFGERAMTAFEQRLDHLALLMMNSETGRELPQFKSLLNASLAQGQGTHWNDLRATLSNRWKFELQAEIENLDKPLPLATKAAEGSQKAVSGFRKALSKVKQKFAAVISPRDLVVPVALNGTMGVMAGTLGFFDSAVFSSELHAMGTYGIFLNGIYLALLVKNHIHAKQSAQATRDVTIGFLSGPQLSSLTINVSQYMEAIGVQSRVRTCPATLTKK